MKQLFLWSALTISTYSFAQLPVEVISSCINNKAVRPTVTVTKLIPPRFIETEETGCEDHFENSIDNLTYGGISCNNYGYIILNSHRIKLSDANNHSVNPAIKPGQLGDRLDLGVDWWKIDFDNNSYICVEAALSTVGDGAANNQYYIVENPYSANPTLNFYFLTDDIMPIKSFIE